MNMTLFIDAIMAGDPGHPLSRVQIFSKYFLGGGGVVYRGLEFGAEVKGCDLRGQGAAGFFHENRQATHKR